MNSKHKYLQERKRDLKVTSRSAYNDDGQVPTYQRRWAVPRSQVFSYNAHKGRNWRSHAVIQRIAYENNKQTDRHTTQFIVFIVWSIHNNNTNWLKMVWFFSWHDQSMRFWLNSKNLLQIFIFLGKNATSCPKNILLDFLSIGLY